MSFILNALRKSEQERQSNHTETLEDKILLKQGNSQKTKPGWLMVLATINLLLLIFFIGYFNQQKEKNIAKNPVTPTEQAKTLPIKQNKPVQVQNSDLITTPQITIAEQIKNDQKKKKQSRKQQPYLKTDQTIKPAKTSQPIPVVAKIQKPDFLVEDSLPYLSEMSYEFSLSVPKLNINAFVYTDHPEGRFIIIDMHKYREGERINKEMDLHEIRPNSLVVEYQNEVFQIRR